MSDLLEVNLSYTDMKGRKIDYPIQGQFFKFILKITNISENIIPGLIPNNGQFGNHLNQGLVQSISFLSNGTTKLAPGESVTYTSKEFRTFYKNLCAINIHLIAHVPIHIILNTPLEKNAAQLKTNSIYAQCFIQDKDEAQNRNLALSNTLLSFVSCITAIVALIISLTSKHP